MEDAREVAAAIVRDLVEALGGLRPATKKLLGQGSTNTGKLSRWMGTYRGEPPSVPSDLNDPDVKAVLRLVGASLGVDRRVALEAAWASARPQSQARRGQVTGELGVDRSEAGDGESRHTEKRRRQRAELAAFLTDAWPFPYVAGLVAPAESSAGSSGSETAIGPSLDVRYRFGSDLFHGNRPMYVRREFDQCLDDRLDRAAESAELGATPLHQRVVVLVGQPKSGKTRSAFEALHRLEQRRTDKLNRSCAYRLLALRTPTDSSTGRGSDTAVVNRFATAYPAGSGSFEAEHRVVFIDDLHHHIAAGAAVQTAFDLICQARPRGTIIVATCWPEAIDSPVSGISHGDRDFLNRVRVDVSVELTDKELDELQTAPTYRRLLDDQAVDIDEFRRIGERHAGVVHLLGQINDAASGGPATAAHHALVLALCDAAYLHPAGIRLEKLRDFVELRFRQANPNRPISNEEHHAAYLWATTPIGGHGSQWAIAGHAAEINLLDALRPHLLPAHTVHAHIVDSANASSLHDAGYTAYLYGRLGEAETWWRMAAAVNHAPSMTNVGLLAVGRGADVEAEIWWRRASELEDTSAMINLGELLRRRGEYTEAKTLLRVAYDAGDAGALFSLGLVLHDQGCLAEAEECWRTAVDTGSPGALNNLGELHRRRGEYPEAEILFRRAVAAGEVNAFYNLGVVLHDQGCLVESAFWYGRAVDVGDVEAAFQLGVVLYELGQPAEGEIWYRRAADAGHNNAMFNLGVIERERGDLAGAMLWWQRVAAADDIEAMIQLGYALEVLNELDQAETWYRRAAVLESGVAMRELADFLEERGNFEEAVEWRRRADDAGGDGPVPAPA